MTLLHPQPMPAPGSSLLMPGATAIETVTIGFATTGRRDILHRTVHHLASLDDRPDRVIVSVAAPEDADISEMADLPFPVDVVTGPKGSSQQRNTILDRMGATGIVHFLDDDFLIADGAITALRRLFADHPDVVMATGQVIADGVRGPGYDHAEGLRLLHSAMPDNDRGGLRDVYSAYGCNMAVRCSALVSHPVRFDATLPLYSWLEDLDFSRQMARLGRVVEDPRMKGVHLATKVGRVSGKRLGYSQIANPIYLMRKGTMHPARAIKLMAGNILANSVKSLRPEPWIDRKGRLWGNLTAFRDLATGRCRPGRILEF